MEPHKPNSELPPIPAKRYFTIGEVSELCGVKAHVLRYWEQEFTQLNPVKRSGNRRYYQHHEVVLIRRIRELLYEQGFTISGARNRLDNPSETVIELDNTGSYPAVSVDMDMAMLKRELRDIISSLSA
ncbi:MAG: MerR family transcriptional regulator [Gallionella sp.]|nr:MerR family transcriptional regulator [Gallionella sp.]MDD4947393.1 MerR family transcriptional regulator [Gallionella sp.]